MCSQEERIRAELRQEKRGADTLPHASAGGREGGGEAGMGRDRARTSIAIRKSGIRWRNIEEKEA